MCQKIFKQGDQIQENYNLIVSNVILSQTDSFNYEDILSKLNQMFEKITEVICNVVQNCLIRLREDGFLRVLGCKYSVAE